MLLFQVIPRPKRVDIAALAEDLVQGGTPSRASNASGTSTHQSTIHPHNES